MNQEKQNFIKALENNDYAEYSLDSEHTLITDMDSKPYVAVESENYQSDEFIVELLEDEILDIFTWDMGESYTQQNLTYYDLFGIRYTY